MRKALPYRRIGRYFPPDWTPVGIRNQHSCHYRVPLPKRAGLSAHRCKWPDTLSYGLARRGRHDRGTAGGESNFEAAFTSALGQRQTRTVDITSRGRACFVECLLVRTCCTRATSSRNALTARRYRADWSLRTQRPAPGTTTVRTRWCATPPAGAPSASPAEQGVGSALEARRPYCSHASAPE